MRVVERGEVVIAPVSFVRNQGGVARFIQRR
jgi:hypothetical protein